MKMKGASVREDMVRICTPVEMAQVDAYAIRTMGYPGLLLMEHAALCCAAEALRMLGAVDDADGGACLRGRRGRPPFRRKVCVYCGPGNNGGDGLALARLLAARGADVVVLLYRDEQRYGGDAKLQLDALKAWGVRIESAPQSPASWDRILQGCDLFVDALLGTGAKGGLRDDALFALDAVERAGAPVLAVDVPSGLDAGAGRVENRAFRAGVTVTMGLPKRGFFFAEAREYVGKLVVGVIGFPPRALSWMEEGRADTGARWWMAGAWAAGGRLPRRRPGAHKGSYGHVVVIGGSPGMSGAVRLAGAAALRAGAGLVRVLCPESVLGEVASWRAEYLTAPLPASPAALAGHLARADAVLVGPGLGRTGPAAPALLSWLLDEWDGPLVLDADALWWVAERNLLAGARKGAASRFLVLTPHGGELNRLRPVPDPRDRSMLDSAALGLARDAGAVVVHKGPFTRVVSPGGDVLVCPSGNDGLATGGSGDVLAGMIASWIARAAASGEPLDDAFTRAALVAGAVYLHGLTADLALSTLGPRSLLPGDCIERMGDACLELERFVETARPSWAGYPPLHRWDRMSCISAASGAAEAVRD